MIDSDILEELLINPNRIPKLKITDISDILCKASDIIGNENTCLELEVTENDHEVYVIGDIHGNFDSLRKILEIIENTNPKFVIFLGDIVDRGEKQLECFISLLILKILNPKKYYLLRGNHETLEMNEYYGFFKEFTSKFKDKERFNEVLALYEVLPYCAIVNNRILCLHGGIPEDFELIRKLKGCASRERHMVLKHLNSGLYHILWNDPKECLSGFEKSYRGQGIQFFGEDVFTEFMNANNLSYLIRSHEMFPSGYKWFFDKHLLSIFSSENYRGKYSKNPASYAIIRNNEVIAKLVE